MGPVVEKLFAVVDLEQSFAGVGREIEFKSITHVEVHRFVGPALF